MASDHEARVSCGLAAQRRRALYHLREHRRPLMTAKSSEGKAVSQGSDEPTTSTRKTGMLISAHPRASLSYVCRLH